MKLSEERLEDIEQALEQEVQTIPWSDIEELHDPDQDKHVPVRLQVRGWNPFDFQVHVGDPSFDKDHRGDWGASLVSPDTDLSQLSVRLLEEAQGLRAQREAV